MIRFTVPGTPSGKERPRATIRNGRAVMYTPKKTAAEEKAIAIIASAALRGSRPMTGPVRVSFTAIFPIPASWPLALQLAAIDGRIFHTQKPDKDNVEKLIWDALKGIAWVDDCQVAAGGGVKRFGNPARLIIEIDELSAPGDIPPPMTPSETRRVKKSVDGQLGLLGRLDSQGKQPKRKRLP